jgi:Ser-tRNA(Ala) deacylase AlaX
MVRIVNVGGLTCPCGGTHVRSTAELGRGVVDGIKVKGKASRVSYHVENAEDFC